MKFQNWFKLSYQRVFLLALSLLFLAVFIRSPYVYIAEMAIVVFLSFHLGVKSVLALELLFVGAYIIAIFLDPVIANWNVISTFGNLFESIIGNGALALLSLMFYFIGVNFRSVR